MVDIEKCCDNCFETEANQCGTHGCPIYCSKEEGYPAWSPDRKTLQSQIQAKDELIKQLIETLRKKQSKAYCDYIDVFNDNLCRGAEYKLKNNSFTVKNLNAHRKAEHLYGKHVAFNEVLKLLKEANNE